MSGIIVGVDGSDHSQRALEWAVREAAVRQTPLTVLTVEPGRMGLPMAYLGDQSLTSRARELAQEQTDKALSQLGDRRRPAVTVRAVNGNPADELIRAGEDADILVAGSRGAGGFTRLLLGSVSTQLTHHAHCPIVLIPSDDARQ